MTETIYKYISLPKNYCHNLINVVKIKRNTQQQQIQTVLLRYVIVWKNESETIMNHLNCEIYNQVKIQMQVSKH